MMIIADEDLSNEIVVNLIVPHSWWIIKIKY